MIVRGLGPSLSALGVPTVLANPTLDMRNANGTLVFTNNDWQDNPVQAGIIAAAGSGAEQRLRSGDSGDVAAGPLHGAAGGIEQGDRQRIGGSVRPWGRDTVPDADTWDLTDPVADADPDPWSVAVADRHPGASPSPSPPWRLQVRATGGACLENFDGQSTLPPGWAQQSPTGHRLHGPFAQTNPDSAPNTAFLSDTAVISDKRLDSRPIAISSAAAQVSFRSNWYDFEFSMTGRSGMEECWKYRSMGQRLWM